MLAAVADQLSADRPLQVREVAEPEVGSGENLVAIECAAVTHLELTILSGRFSLTPPVPFIPGSEACGRILSSETHRQFRAQPCPCGSCGALPSGSMPNRRRNTGASSPSSLPISSSVQM